MSCQMQSAEEKVKTTQESSQIMDKLIFTVKCLRVVHGSLKGDLGLSLTTV